MDELPISEFKTKLNKIIKRAQKTKQPFRITWQGKTVAEILVIKPTPTVDRAKWIGSMKDTMKIYRDIVSPANEPED
ncbi:MAG: type II toxin-antitoxin system Phd/YefM family antitoxin [Candidatus Acidiferrum sp.]